jgi:hypothetical protein
LIAWGSVPEVRFEGDDRDQKVEANDRETADLDQGERDDQDGAADDVPRPVGES